MAHARAVGPHPNHVIGAIGRGQHNRTAHDGNPVRAVRQAFNRGSHRQLNFHLIAVMPFTADIRIGRRRGNGRKRAGRSPAPQSLRRQPMRDDAGAG